MKRYGLFLFLLFTVACRGPAPADVAAGRPAPTAAQGTGERSTPVFRPPAELAEQPEPDDAATFVPLVTPGENGYPTLADLWHGTAEFVLEVVDTGLPMGESDTHLRSDATMWSYFHASHQSAGAIDQCGDPVPFPGCTIIYRSVDGGYQFSGDNPPVCQISCQQCPCDNEIDHVAQQQYPDLVWNEDEMIMVYEFLGRTMLRTSTEGLNWSEPDRVAETGIWKEWFAPCPAAETIGHHPFVPYDFECLSGAPPGSIIADGQLFVFVAVGQNPGGLGCYFRPVDQPEVEFRRCQNNPLFSGVNQYGPHDIFGPLANAYYDFRTISSAEVQLIGTDENRRYYALYEGIRGPGPLDGGDSQFSLALARSQTSMIDGPWERFDDNPLLVDLPGNVGVGHADLLVVEGQTILYTSLDGQTRSRLTLIWK